MNDIRSYHFRGPFITALGKTWCPNHFSCAQASCGKSLQDCGFVEEQGLYNGAQSFVTHTGVNVDALHFSRTPRVRGLLRPILRT